MSLSLRIPDNDINLLDFSNTLSRIAEEVRQLAQVAGPESRIASGPLPVPAPSVSAELAAAEAICRDRRLRQAIFYEYSDLLNDHAFDMLLTLYIGHERQSALSVTSVCFASGAPPTTALRHISRLQANGLIERSDDPFDRRRHILRLTEVALLLMRSYLSNNFRSPRIGEYSTLT